MAANSELQSVGIRDRWQGFNNLLRKENRMWWHTSRWWKQALIWLVLMNGLLLLAFKGGMKNPDGSAMPAEALAMMGLVGFVQMAGSFASIGVVLQAQETLLDEKRLGTAAWVLSKPVTRAAVILSKLAAYGMGILITTVLAQAAVAYGMMRAISGVMPPALPFAKALGMIYLALVFWLTLTVTLSAVSNSRGLVLGVPLLLVFAPVLVGGMLPAWVWDIMPWNLTYAAAGIRPSLADCLLAGQPVTTWMPAIITAVGCVILTLAAIWGFKKEEF